MYCYCTLNYLELDFALHSYCKNVVESQTLLTVYPIHIKQRHTYRCENSCFFILRGSQNVEI